MVAWSGNSVVMVYPSWEGIKARRTVSESPRRRRGGHSSSTVRFSTERDSRKNRYCRVGSGVAGWAGKASVGMLVGWGGAVAWAIAVAYGVGVAWIAGSGVLVGWRGAGSWGGRGASV